MEKKVTVCMQMIDEFGEYTEVQKEFEFDGYRGFEQADCIMSQAEAFLRACDFAMVSDNYDVQLIEK